MDFHQLIHDGHGWETLKSETRYANPYAQFREVEVRTPTRPEPVHWTVVHRKGAAIVVPVTAGGDFLLVRQERIPVRDTLWEFPAGQIDEAGGGYNEEGIRATALRELREETGYAGAPAKLLGSVHPNPAIQSNRCHFILVEAAVPSHALDWDPDEEIHVTTEPVDDVLALARSGGIIHGLVLNALLLFEPHWRAMKKR